MTDEERLSEFPVRVDRNVYPRPEYRYPNVKIGVTYKDSIADFFSTFGLFIKVNTSFYTV